ncbi:MAG: phosphate ABC transporter substrate-binding protein, partial [Crenarchaeota archaeon]|nr:phosphate ABC transporter substrate-binding protein [Thermoproteota archaeon]
MNWVLFSLILVFAGIGIIPSVHAETVPDWVKNTAGWWANDAISEKEFVNAVGFLVNEGII